MDDKIAPRIKIEDLPQELPLEELEVVRGGFKVDIDNAGGKEIDALLGGCQAIGGIATQVNL